MINILIHGCNGRMGKMISDMAINYPEIKIAAGVDISVSGGRDFPVYTSLKDVKESIDAIIDVSTAKAFDALCSYVDENGIPAVICTTGLNDEQTKQIEELSKKTALLRSGNMSMGINTVIKVLNEISAKLTAAGFDTEIIEKHHRMKVDAPSGTALMLADAVRNSALADAEYVYNRNERRTERPKNEIGISSVRAGTIVGEHEVIFAGPDEIIEIKHTALSRAVFANGAINAAVFLYGKEKGLYSMSDVIG